jgi:DNA-binding LytR/AlgR family response regulator
MRAAPPRARAAGAAPRAVVADDEPLLREALVAALAQAWPALRVVAACADGDAALEAIERERPEVAFLDIRMPGRTGLQVAQAAASPHAPLWVFVTAYDAHALDAFERDAVDYLLKPIAADRLAQAARGEAFVLMGGDCAETFDTATAEDIRAKMIAGSFDIFAGELKDNTGKVVIPKGTVLKQTDPVLEGMNYLVEGVIGSIPG